eukprot:g17849.t1
MEFLLRLLPDAHISFQENPAREFIFQLAPRIVNTACPELTFVPTKALISKRSIGIIVQVGNEGGLIECPELEAAFGCPVLFRASRGTSRHQLGPYSVGQEATSE